MWSKLEMADPSKSENDKHLWTEGVLFKVSTTTPRFAISNVPWVGKSGFTDPRTVVKDIYRPTTRVAVSGVGKSIADALCLYRPSVSC
jgi:hypothetical protein